MISMVDYLYRTISNYNHKVFYMNNKIDDDFNGANDTLSNANTWTLSYALRLQFLAAINRFYQSKFRDFPIESMVKTKDTFIKGKVVKGGELQTLVNTRAPEDAAWYGLTDANLINFIDIIKTKHNFLRNLQIDLSTYFEHAKKLRHMYYQSLPPQIEQIKQPKKEEKKHNQKQDQKQDQKQSHRQDQKQSHRQDQKQSHRQDQKQSHRQDQKQDQRQDQKQDQKQKHKQNNQERQQKRNKKNQMNINDVDDDGFQTAKKTFRPKK